MRRTTHALWVLYTALAVGLLACALDSYQDERWHGVAFFCAGAIGCALAIVHTSCLLDEHSAALAAAGRPTRPSTPTRHDATVQQVLAQACCEVWWTSMGAEHDFQHCTRKDAGA